MAKSMILAGDVGGTKTNLAFVPATGRGTIGAPAAFESYKSADFPSFEAMLEEFRGAHDVPFDAASFGYAGAVENGRGVGSNLPWIADHASLARALSLPRAHVMNDLVATGYGIAALSDSDLETILPGPRGRLRTSGSWRPGRDSARPCSRRPGPANWRSPRKAGTPTSRRAPTSRSKSSGISADGSVASPTSTWSRARGS